MGADAEEVAQLRDDVRTLRAMIDTALDRRGDRIILAALGEVLRERRERLEKLERASEFGNPRRSRQ